MLVTQSLPSRTNHAQAGEPNCKNSHSYEDLSIGSQLKAMVYAERQTPPNTLDLSGFTSSMSRSEPELSSCQTPPNTEADDLLWHDKCVVYISYTDRMACWVREYLKPMIESWEHSEVMLHEDDMIPGFTIPGERQRLILEAHKVVLVVSRDYSKSSWCLYELQHAIQQEPALCQGRIIPILVDGCQTVPAIVRGVVPLMETDRNFSTRLRKNILGKSQCYNV